VVLEGAAAPAPAEPTAELSLAGFGFQPAFQAVTAGTRLNIRNLDPRPYSCSASGASSFQIETLAAGQNVTQTLGSEGIVEVRCHGYPFSRATILVVARGVWTTPDAEGKFVFANVPAGEYRARLFANRSWHFESPVAVTAQGTIQLALGAPQTPAGESPGEAKKPTEAVSPAPPPEQPKPATPSAPPVAARPVENKPPPAPPAPKPKPAEPKPKPDKPAPKEPAGGFSDVEPEVEVEVE
jgi:hypothetical protein